MKFFRLSIFLSLALALAAPLSAQQKLPTAAVMDLDASGVSENEGRTLGERLRAEIFRLRAFDLMERGKMREILAEQGFQQSGACDDACVVEAGKMVGVEKMIAGSVGRVGKTYSLGLRLIDVRTGRLENYVDQDFRGTVDELLTREMAVLARQLCQEVSNVKVSPAKGRPFYKKWWFWTGLGAAAAGGTAAVLLTKDKETAVVAPDNTLPLPPNPPQAPGFLPHP